MIDNCLNMWETILSKMEQHPVQMVVSEKLKSQPLCGVVIDIIQNLNKLSERAHAHTSIV